MLFDEVNEIRVILNRFRYVGLIVWKFIWCIVYRIIENWFINSKCVWLMKVMENWWFLLNCIGSFGL